MDERMKVLGEVTELLKEGLRKEWTLKEFGEVFVATLAVPAMYHARHAIEETLGAFAHG